MHVVSSALLTIECKARAIIGIFYKRLPACDAGQVGDSSHGSRLPKGIHDVC